MLCIVRLAHSGRVNSPTWASDTLCPNYFEEDLFENIKYMQLSALTLVVISMVL